MTMQDPDNVAGLIAAYALGALSEQEAAQVETLLQTSEQARAELRAYEEALVAFATLTPRRQAPASLESTFRARLAAEAAPSASATETSQKASSPVGQDAPTIRPGAPLEQPRTGPARIRPELRRRSPWRTALVGLVAAIVVIAVGALILYNAISGEDRAIRAIVDDAAALRVDLAAQEGASGTLSVVYVPGQTNAVLVAQLPQLEADRQYQFWFIQPDQIQSGGVFSPGQDTRYVLVTIPDIRQEYTLGLTIERAGGVDQPTMAPIFLGTLPNLG
jgi:anti-sigma-K factor RskA